MYPWVRGTVVARPMTTTATTTAMTFVEEESYLNPYPLRVWQLEEAVQDWVRWEIPLVEEECPAMHPSRLLHLVVLQTT